VPAGPDPDPMKIPCWYFELNWAILTVILLCFGFFKENIGSKGDLKPGFSAVIPALIAFVEVVALA
jgi:hypothetical protein